MPPDRRHLLWLCLRQVRAREQLRLVEAIALAASPMDPADRREALRQLVLVAYEGDPAELAVHLESLSRKGG